MAKARWKSHLREVNRLYIKRGPKMVTVRENEEAVILSKKDYETLLGEKLNFLDFMKQSPFYSLDLNFDRDRSQNREIEL